MPDDASDDSSDAPSDAPSEVPAEDGPDESLDLDQVIARSGPLTFGERDDAVRPGRRVGVRVLITLAVVGGLLAVAFAVIGIVAVRHYLEDRSGTGATIAARYQKQYRTCVEDTGDLAGCGAQSRPECAADPQWKGVADRATEIPVRCRFGPG